jgi:hypothetical protein
MKGLGIQIPFLVGYFFLAAAAGAHDYDVGDFASEIVDYNGPFGMSPYDEPNAVLGKPTTWVYDDWEELTYACSLVSGAAWTDPEGNKLVTTLEEGAEIVADDPCNPYGLDFIVFGNSFFKADGTVEPGTDMETYFLLSPASIYADMVLVSVAQGPSGPWYAFADGPYADDLFPTNAFAWDSNTGDWGDELDWLKPVNPSLSLSDFDGLSAADAIELYDGSAGGTGFDLKELEPNDYAALTAEPNSGQKWVQYIKVAYLPGGSYAGEIDGFADVAGCGDYKHPYPVGDINGDCSVNYSDLALLCGYWLAEVSGPDDPAVRADIYEDDVVDFLDWAMIAENWAVCSWECE